MEGVDGTRTVRRGWCSHRLPLNELVEVLQNLTIYDAHITWPPNEFEHVRIGYRPTRLNARYTPLVLLGPMPMARQPRQQHGQPQNQRQEQGESLRADLEATHPPHEEPRSQAEWTGGGR